MIMPILQLRRLRHKKLRNLLYMVDQEFKPKQPDSRVPLLTTLYKYKPGW